MHPHSSTTLPHLDYRWVFAASLLLSAWLIALDPLINRDAIIYLRAADAYLQGGFGASQQVFGRPLLPIAMALINQWTGLSTMMAGLLIVTLFYALMCTGFVATVHTLGGDRRVQIIAAAVIISHPILNHDRSSIMRDPIYWALLIMSFRELLLYLRNPGLKHRVRWFVYIFLAAMFRFEGLFYALLAPLSLLLLSDLPQRVRHCMSLVLPQLVALSVVMLGIFLYREQLAEGTQLFPSLQNYFQRLLDFPAEFSAVATATGESMLRFTAQEDAPIAILAGLAAILLLNLCRALTWPWVLVLLWGQRAGLLHRLRSGDDILLKAHLLIGFSYLSLFLLINRFMIERYCDQLVIFLLLYLPFVLSTLWGAGGWRKALVIVLLLGMSGDSLHTGAADKSFIRDATDWVADNTPVDASVTTNEKYIAYFSEREFDWKFALGQQFQLTPILDNPAHWQRRDYMVIYVRKRDEERWQSFLAANDLQELRAFRGESDRKGRVAIVATGSQPGAD